MNTPLPCGGPARRFARGAGATLLLALLAGCKVNIIVPEGGKVVSESGEYDCASGTCVIEVADTTFDQTFSAAPNAGFVFDGWRTDDNYLCGGSTGTCRLNTTGFGASPPLMAILASDDDFFLEPVFRPAQDYSASGTITIASTAFTDGDTNDPLAPFIVNDTVDTAQPVPNPVSIGGYAAVLGAGPEGALTGFSDRDDFFAIDLVAGQVLQMLVADPQAGDLDLYLHDAAGNIVDASLDTGFIECLQVASAGRYFLNPYAFAGASNYTLTVGQSGSCGAQGAMTLGAEFRPGEAIVQQAPDVGTSSGGGDAGRERLVALDPAAAVSTQSLGSKQSTRFRDDDLRERWQTLHAIKALRRRSNVKMAVPNYVAHAYARTPNDRLYPFQRHYDQINLPDAWTTTIGSRDTIVAVLDTGVLLDHPDMAGQLVPGYDFISELSLAIDGDGIDTNPNDDGDNRGSGIASSFHGTHVAGTVAAASDNGIGGAGVSWLSRIMPIRVLGRGGSGTTYDIIQGFRYAAGLANDSGTRPQRPADVINMSLGGGAPVQTFQNVINRAREKGIVVIAAAGNENTSAASYPAWYDGVISVGAVDYRNGLAPYSNFGNRQDVVAPGGDMSVDADGNGLPDGVISTQADDTGSPLQYTWDLSQGTSMAAPHVAGVVALMLSVDPALDATAVDTLLAAGDLTVDLGPAGRDNRFGHGLIDARKAIDAASRGPSTPPPAARLGVAPASLSLTTDAATFTVGNAGTGSLEVTGVETNVSWLEVQPTDVDNSGLGLYTAVADLSALIPGTYEAVVTVNANAGSRSLPVIVSVGSTQYEPSTGIVYALLLTEDWEVVAQQELAPSGGRYQFRYDGIPEGNHYLFVGSDRNNDGFICDAAEACGAYRLVGRPQQIVLDRDRSALDFGISFDASLSSAESAAAGIGGLEPVPALRRAVPDDRGLRRMPAETGGERPASPRD